MSTALVSLVNGIPTTTSLKVAEVFGKNHKDVLRGIASLQDKCPKEFTERNFALSEYTDNTGRKLPMYLLTRDGLTLLVMGYTGKEAMKFKLAYIEAFNCMERQLEAQRTAPAVPPLSTTSDRRKLNNLVREWAALSGQSFPDCWAEIHVAFEIDAVADLPCTKVKEAEDYVRARIRDHGKPALGFKPELAVYGSKANGEPVNLWDELKEAERILKGVAAGIALKCNSGSLMYMTAEKHLFHKILTTSADHAAASVLMAMQAVRTCLSVKSEVDFFKV